MRVSVSLYLLSLFLIGVGYIAIMPPYEGFDEPAHYASLRQIADADTIPIFGKSFLPQDVVDYRGPVPYSTIEPVFRNGVTYPEFFAREAMIKRFVEDYRRPQPPGPFIPTANSNWEAQHPPLYYLMLAPMFRLVQATPFVTQILILRIASYSLALAGVFFGLMAIPAGDAITRPIAALSGFFLYPIMLPMFFPEFARMGNDSACLLFAGLAALCLTRGFANERSIGWPSALGISLGLGLLSKAFFIPITFAIGLFLLVRWWRIRDDKSRLRLRNAAIAVALAVAIGGGWYLRDYLSYGDFSGSADAIHIAAEGGIWTNLKQHHSLYAFVRATGVMIVTWVWAGTWSFARMSALLYAPLFLLIAMAIGGLIVRLRHTSIVRPEWLPVLLFVCLGGGLFVHVIDMVEIGQGGTGGWYLHILMPWVAPALGVGVEAVVQRRWRRLSFAALVSYALLFQAMAMWAQVALFSGCAVKGSDKYYSFPGHAFCLDQAATIYDRLSIVGWPVLACIGFGGGLLCAAGLAIRMQWKVAPK